MSEKVVQGTQATKKSRTQVWDDADIERMEQLDTPDRWYWHLDPGEVIKGIVRGSMSIEFPDGLRTYMVVETSAPCLAKRGGDVEPQVLEAGEWVYVALRARLVAIHDRIIASGRQWDIAIKAERQQKTKLFKVWCFDTKGRPRAEPLGGNAPQELGAPSGGDDAMKLLTGLAQALKMLGSGK